GQGRQAPFASYFFQTLEQKVRVPKPALDGSERMFGQRLPQLELLRLRLHPCRHRFHQSLVLLPRDPPVGLVPRALFLQRAALTTTGLVISDLAPQFIGVEPMRQLRSRRTHIHILLLIVAKPALAI